MVKPEPRPPKVDMSSSAIDRRLREVSELRRLCLSLARARRLGPVKSLRKE